MRRIFETCARLRGRKGAFMRYHLDTIPVWDALKQPFPCPLCALRRKIELIDVDRCLGGSVMEPEIRIQVNEKGFCPHHQVLLYAQRNRLGHALMMHTHLKRSHEKLSPLFSQAQNAAAACAGAPLTKKLTGNKDAKAALKEAALNIRQQTESCILCDTIEENMNRYMYTFLHLYKTDASFRTAFENSDGVCVPDAARLLTMAADELSGDMLVQFTTALSQLTEKSLTKLEGDLEGFTLKFDYRNQDKPWGDSKGSLERTVTKLLSWCIGEEPNPK